MEDLYNRFQLDPEKDLEQLIKDCINSRGVETLEDFHRYA